MSVDLNPVWELFRWNVTEELGRFKEIRWDRFVQDDTTLRVYGWIDRPDGRADFVLLDWHLEHVDGEPFVKSEYLTSSVEFSEKRAAEWKAEGGNPSDYHHCERVQFAYPHVSNVVRLAS